MSADHRPRFGIRFVLCGVIGAVAGFALWCGADYILVRLVPYPDHIHDLDLAIFVYPIVLFITTARVLHWKIDLAIVATFLAYIAAATMIWFLGIPFHFYIGGGL